MQNTFLRTREKKTTCTPLSLYRLIHTSTVHNEILRPCPVPACSTRNGRFRLRNYFMTFLTLLQPG